MTLTRRSTCGLDRRCNQWLPIFLAKETLFPSCVGITPYLEAEGVPFIGSSAHWTNCFCPHDNSSYMEFNRCTMEALTLQRSQITAYSSCVLLILPITKTGKRTGETQSVIIDDLLLVSIFNRLLCVLSPSDNLMQRSPHSFRRTVWEETGWQSTGYFFETWIRSLRNIADPLWRPRVSILKRALSCTIPCRSKSKSIPQTLQVIIEVWRWSQSASQMIR